MQLNEILKYADQLVFLIEATLDNTLKQQHALDDCVAGFVPYCGHDHGVTYRTNAQVKMSTDTVLDTPTAIVIGTGVSKQSSYPEPHGDAMITATYGHIRIANVTSIDQWLLRKFRGKNVTIKVGGIIHKGKPNEQELTGDEYALYFVGQFVSYDFDDEILDISIGMDSGELSYNFPLRRFESGKLEGQAIPFTCGSPKGVKFPVVREGVGKFHDGLVDTSDIVRDDVQIGYVGYGINFYPILELDPGYSKDSSGFVNYGRSAHSFANDGTDSVTLSGVMTGSVSVAGDGATVVANGDSFEIVQDIAESQQRLDSSAFTWVITDAQNVATANGHQASATLTGALEIESVGGRWFKVFDSSGSNTGGRVTIDLGGVVGELQLVLRQKDLAGITLVTPYDAIGPQDGSTENWEVTFNNLNSRVVEFDYQRPITGDLVAVWIKSMLLFRANPVQVTISIDAEIAYLGLGVESGAGSQGFTEFSVEPIPVLGAGALSSEMVFEVDNTNQIKFTYLSGYGSSSFYFNEIRVEESEYGAYREGDLIVLRPPPVAIRSGECSALITIEADGKTNVERPFVFGYQYQTMVRARLISASIDSVTILVGKAPFGEPVTLTPEWQDILVDTELLDFGTNKCGIEAFRGTKSIKFGAVLADNADVDFEVKVECLSVFPLMPSLSPFSLYDNKDSERSKFQTYRVTDTSKFDQLPPNLGLYDDSGNVVFAKTYTDLVADTLGWKADAKSIESFRKISELATGVDQITCDFEGELSDFVIYQGGPWIDPVAAKSSGLDYVIKENETTSGITITRRPKSTDLALDFHITEDQVIPGSLRPISGHLREHRFIVEYSADLSDSTRTKTIKSVFGYTGDTDARRISTCLREYEDAVARGDSIVLESLYNNIVPLGLFGIGLGFECGMYGAITHPRIADGRRCIIIDVDETDDRETYLLLHVFRV